jgi:hypothetical protein
MALPVCDAENLAQMEECRAVVKFSFERFERQMVMRVVAKLK